MIGRTRNRTRNRQTCRINLRIPEINHPLQSTFACCLPRWHDGDKDALHHHHHHYNIFVWQAGWNGLEISSLLSFSLLLITALGLRASIGCHLLKDRPIVSSVLKGSTVRLEKLFCQNSMFLRKNLEKWCDLRMCNHGREDGVHCVCGGEGS